MSKTVVCPCTLLTAKMTSDLLLRIDFGDECNYLHCLVGEVLAARQSSCTIINNNLLPGGFPPLLSTQSVVTYGGFEDDRPE